MNDEFDMPNQAIDEPFSTADELRLGRLQSGLSTLRGQMDTGEIDQESGQEFERQIQSHIGALAVRQQQAQEKQQQAQEQQMQKSLAHAEALQHANSVYRAKGFDDRVVVYTDPLTGDRAHLYESKPNTWDQIEFPDKEENSYDVNLPGLGMAAGAGGEDRNTMTIWNGPHRSVITRDDNGHIIKQEGDPRGMVPGAPGYKEAVAAEQRGHGSEHALHQAEIAELYKQVQKAVPMPQQPANMNNPHAAQAYQSALGERDRQVNSLVSHLAQNAWRSKENKSTAERRVSDKQAALDSAEAQKATKVAQDDMKKAIVRQMTTLGKEEGWKDKPYAERLKEVESRIQAEQDLLHPPAKKTAAAKFGQLLNVMGATPVQPGTGLSMPDNAAPEPSVATKMGNFYSPDRIGSGFKEFGNRLNSLFQNLGVNMGE